MVLPNQRELLVKIFVDELKLVLIQLHLEHPHNGLIPHEMVQLKLYEVYYQQRIVSNLQLHIGVEQEDNEFFKDILGGNDFIEIGRLLIS